MGDKVSSIMESAYNKLNIPEGFIERFNRQADHIPQAVAIEILPSGEQYSYGELRAMAGRIKSSLIQMGIGRGDRVVIMLPASAHFVASVLALTSLGALSVFTGAGLTAYELKPRLDDAKPCGAIVADETMIGRLTSCETLRFALTLRPVTGTTGNNRIQVRSLQDLQGRGVELTSPVHNPLTGCHFTYKGFGYPVGAVHRYNDYSWVLSGLENRFGDSASSNHLLALPMYPVYGLLASMFALSLGCRLIVVQDLRDVDLYRVITDRQIRLTGLVPVLIKSLISQGLEYKRQGRDPKRDFPRIWI